MDRTGLRGLEKKMENEMESGLYRDSLGSLLIMVLDSWCN